MTSFNTTDGLIALNDNEEVVLCNGRAEQILKIKEKEILGKRCHYMRHRPGLSEILSCDKECSVAAMKKENKSVPNFNWQVKTKPNQSVLLNGSILISPEV